MFKNLKKIYSCAKQPLDIFTVKLCYPVSIRIVSLIQDTKITPNHLTLISFFLALISSYFFFIQTASTLIYGSLILYLSYVFDCADGQLARFQGQFSPFGGWLDQILDRLREFLLILSLSWGYYNKTSDYTIWIFGFAALFLLFLLEYYAQQNQQLPELSQDKKIKITSEYKKFSLIKTIYTIKSKLFKIFPFLEFNIGEQTFIIIILTIFNQVRLLLIVMVFLGFFQVIYRPLFKIYSYKKAKNF